MKHRWLFLWAHQVNRESRVVPVDDLEWDRVETCYTSTSRNNLLLYFFSFVSSRTTQDKNGVSTWRDHQSTHVCCVTHLHSSRFVAYTSSLVLSQSADGGDSSLPGNTFNLNRFFKCCCWYAETNFRLFPPSAWRVHGW